MIKWIRTFIRGLYNTHIYYMIGDEYVNLVMSVWTDARIPWSELERKLSEAYGVKIVPCMTLHDDIDQMVDVLIDAHGRDIDSARATLLILLE